MESNDKKLFETWKAHRESRKAYNRKRHIEIALYVARARDMGIKVTRAEVDDVYNRQYGK